MRCPAAEARWRPIHAADTNGAEALRDYGALPSHRRGVHEIELHIELHEAFAPAHNCARRKRSFRNTNWFRERRSHGSSSAALHIISDRLGLFYRHGMAAARGQVGTIVSPGGNRQAPLSAQRNKARYGRYNAPRSRLLISLGAASAASVDAEQNR